MQETWQLEEPPERMDDSPTIYPRAPSAVPSSGDPLPGMAPVPALLLCFPLVYGVFLFLPCSGIDCIFNITVIGRSQGLEEDVYASHVVACPSWAETS